MDACSGAPTNPVDRTRAAMAKIGPFIFIDIQPPRLMAKRSNGDENKRSGTAPRGPGPINWVGWGTGTSIHCSKQACCGAETTQKCHFGPMWRCQREVFTPSIHRVIAQLLRRWDYSHQPTGDRTCTGYFTRARWGSGQNKYPIAPHDMLENRRL